jgi:hypothetical protein
MHKGKNILRSNKRALRLLNEEKNFSGQKVKVAGRVSVFNIIFQIAFLIFLSYLLACFFPLMNNIQWMGRNL